MTASHIDAMVLPYLEGQLSPPEADLVESHLAECAQCSANVRQVRLALAAMATLRRTDAAGTRPAGRGRRTLAAAMAASLLVGGAIGFLAHYTLSRPAATDGPQFMLLFEERNWPPPAPLARSGYGEHAAELREREAFAGGEKLTDDTGWIVHQDGSITTPSGPNFSGWFLVRARDYRAAIELARASPHRRWGNVLVRQVER